MPMFNTLHLMFETQYNELALAVNLIAERIRALGQPRRRLINRMAAGAVGRPQHPGSGGGTVSAIVLRAISRST
jgi:hypothetical protein